MSKRKKLWFSTGSGRIEFSLSLEQAERGAHSGQCDADIAELLQDKEIATQLSSIDPVLLAAELKEYGAWDDAELLNHADNLGRILWIACGDVQDYQLTQD